MERLFTPHARGSTVLRSTITFWAEVYPACAGIDLMGVELNYEEPGLPRMRGDRPPRERLVNRKGEFTPHARGSTTDTLAVKHQERVYPACAGIDP